MKVVLLNTFSGGSGAAQSTRRLHLGLLGAGISSTLLAAQHCGEGGGRGVEILRPTIWQRLRELRWWEKRVLRPYRKTRNKDAVFSFNPMRMVKLDASAAFSDADIVQLNWVGWGMLTPEQIGDIRKPLVWRLPDLWPLTGGCHYAGECRRYEEHCGACPLLGSSREKDAASNLFKRKMSAWKNQRITFVAPSRWIADCVRRSALFLNGQNRVEIIPTGVDALRMKLISRREARQRLGLPEDGIFVVFGADDAASPRKGLPLLLEACRIVTERIKNTQLHLVVFGAGCEKVQFPPSLQVHTLGKLAPDKLNLAYAAGDLFAAPSKEENLANTVLEAMACGRPCLAFGVGGMPDAVIHGENGFLAEPFDTGSLAAGIEHITADAGRWKQLSENAREKVEKDFSLERQVLDYSKLYRDIIETHDKFKSWTRQISL